MPTAEQVDMEMIDALASVLTGVDHRPIAGLGDPLDDLLRPARLDPDHHGRRHVGVGAGADDRAPEQLQVLAELKPPVGMRQRQR